jgi:hypothetical protein
MVYRQSEIDILIGGGTEPARPIVAADVSSASV